jgi:hypothetical protein
MPKQERETALAKRVHDLAIGILIDGLVGVASPEVKKSLK